MKGCGIQGLQKGMGSTKRQIGKEKRSINIKEKDMFLRWLHSIAYLNVFAV